MARRNRSISRRTAWSSSGRTRAVSEAGSTPAPAVRRASRVGASQSDSPASATRSFGVISDRPPPVVWFRRSRNNPFALFVRYRRVAEGEQ